MGYDMLEGSEMGALTESRLGNKCFVNDEDFSNLSIGRGKKARKLTLADAWWPIAITNTLGITNFTVLTQRQKKEREEFERKKVQDTWKLDQTKISDCTYLTTRLEQLQNTIASESEIYIKDKVAQKRILTPLKKMEVEYKNAITQAKCEETRTKAEEEATKKETLDLLTTATATPPSGSANDEKSSKTTKYIMYGVGGLILVLGIIIVIKKSN